MRTLLTSLAATALAAVAVVLAAPAASAATAPAPVPGGYDVSYPQCSTTLPDGAPFAVVGVNGGLATTANPCLAAQLSWAVSSSGMIPSQPRAQLYLNTGDPGQVRDQVKTWPTGGSTPYGACHGGNGLPCNWQYGWERAQASATTIFAPAASKQGVDPAPGDYTWWLDVETVNTWQSGSSAALAANRAALEGMTAYLTGAGARVGLYSSSQQWTAIAGKVPTTSPLHGLPSWLAGSTSVAAASAACSARPLVAGGQVAMTQWVGGGIDHDVSCR